MLPTAFSAPLAAAVAGIPGARGAVFVDWEGEAVDQFAPDHTPTGIRLEGAHWGIVYRHCGPLLAALAGVAGDGSPEVSRVHLRFAAQQVLIRRVEAGYLLVVTLDPGTDPALAWDAVERAAATLREAM